MLVPSIELVPSSRKLCPHRIRRRDNKRVRLLAASVAPKCIYTVLHIKARPAAKKSCIAKAPPMQCLRILGNFESTDLLAPGFPPLQDLLLGTKKKQLSEARTCCSNQLGSSRKHCPLPESSLTSRLTTGSAPNGTGKQKCPCPGLLTHHGPRSSAAPASESKQLQRAAAARQAND